MAIQKEIWMAAIVEGLFASNSFLSKAFNADEYVNNGKIVHIPNAGAASGTKKNRTELPAKVTKRTDIDVTFPLDEYTTDPVLILTPTRWNSAMTNGSPSCVRINSNCRMMWHSISFSTGVPPPHSALKTTGAEIDAYTDKPVSAKVSAGRRVGLDDQVQYYIPQEGRYLLLDAQMYSSC